MDAIKRLLITVVLGILVLSGNAQEKYQGLHWISSGDKNANQPNTWIAFRKDIVLTEAPREAQVIISADTKYWLWVNGKLAIFEGGLKRGPNPRDSYYDKVDIASYLKQGKNQIALLLWHFGKDGFSHKNSGRSGLLFHMSAGKYELFSDHTWLCCVHPAYGTAPKPDPNFRLSESNIRFDARKDLVGWQVAPLYSIPGFIPAAEIGVWGDAPWNKLIERPIPQWKDFGIKEAKFERHYGKTIDTIVARLPYNMQMTPVIKVADALGGQLLSINTDHSWAGGTDNIRAEYITKKGLQEYESFGWMNGEAIMLNVPHGVRVLSVKYRETGYNAIPEGTFECSDSFYNLYWKKAQRTLYINMRDNFFDCPDRERAQWWGDAVLLMGESFYTYSTATHALMAKAIHQLAGWQRPDSALFSPIPGNYDTELADQMLASIGDYGFWNYYLNTGDRKTIEDVYPAVRKYLALWKTDADGLTVTRQGGWLWGDWGDNRDIRLIQAGWHYMALDGAAKMADLLGFREEANAYRTIMAKLKLAYNKCWDGDAYRSPLYKEETDDRVQALAVISGIADSSKYQKIARLFKTQFHASPYMEKYVMEALFTMGEGEYALERTQKRFAPMVNNPDYSTLFEGWGIGEEGFGGGTTNHAWSGGAQIVIAQKLCGISPLEAGFKTFLIEPSPASFESASISVPTIRGLIKSSFKNNRDGFVMNIDVPIGTTAIVRLPASSSAEIKVGGHLPTAAQLTTEPQWQREGYTAIKLGAGSYTIVRNKKM